MQTTGQSGSGNSSNQINPSQVNSWINSASPDDLINVGNTLLSRIGSLDQTYRDKFVKQAQNNPSVSKLFNQQDATVQ